MRRTLRRHPFLLSVLSLVILSQAGCQSDFFGPCGPCANGPFRRLGARIFNRPGPLCGGGAAIVSDVPVYEAPPAVVTPVPAPTLTPGAVLPAPAEVAPQIEPLEPEPAPSASPGVGSSGTQGTRASTGKANYEAARPRDRLGRLGGFGASRDFSRATPVPTSRSALGSFADPAPVVATAKRVEPAPGEYSLLDNLPPLELPREGMRASAARAAVPSAVEDGGDEVRSRFEVASVEPDPEPEVEPDPQMEPDPEPEPEPDVADVVPGLRRFVEVEPRLAGGSLPGAKGLDWLHEKGYRTLVDLREPGEVESSFIAEASNRGMRYVSLPISLKSLDQDHLDRFHFEISLADARPIYFFDADGNRPGVLWYIHRMTDAREGRDAQEASREAEELGLAALEFREAADRFVDATKAQPPSMTPVETADSTPPAAPETTEARPAAEPPAPVEAASNPEPLVVPPSGSSIPSKPDGLAAAPATSEGIAEALPAPAATPKAGLLHDPNAWRPFLALLLAALGVPCAYWSRSLISFRLPKRASLPGPERPLRSLPASSGE